MSFRKTHKRSGFTLVELLTAIAIIVLLIGVLVPALSSARTQARKATTAGMIKAIDSGCEMFRGDFKQYPKSRDPNPFEGDSNILLMGFQWLGLQLVGPDSGGIVDWRDLRNDTNKDKLINEIDWRDWYSLTPNRVYPRLGPYASIEGDAVQSLKTYRNVRTSYTAPPLELEKGVSDWPNKAIPFFVDSFTNPVLYYRANAQTDKPFTTGTPSGTFEVGQYDQTDNGYITGSAGTDGRYGDVIGNQPGWDIAGTGYTPPYVHDLGEFGYTGGTSPQLTFPLPKTFAGYMCDGKMFDNTVNSSGKGRLWPYRENSYVLISAGPDGVYGNKDDITNFQATR